MRSTNDSCSTRLNHLKPAPAPRASSASQLSPLHSTLCPRPPCPRPQGDRPKGLRRAKVSLQRHPAPAARLPSASHHPGAQGPAFLDTSPRLAPPKGSQAALAHRVSFCASSGISSPASAQTALTAISRPPHARLVDPYIYPSPHHPPSPNFHSRSHAIQLCLDRFRQPAQPRHVFSTKLPAYLSTKHFHGYCRRQPDGAVAAERLAAG